MGAVFSAIVYLLVFVVVPIVAVLLAALAVLAGIAVIGAAIHRPSRRLAVTGSVALVLGVTVLVVLGPYAVSQAEWYFEHQTAVQRR
jgi:hypothetical protein